MNNQVKHYELYLKNSSCSVGIYFNGSPQELVRKFTNEKGFISFDSMYEGCPFLVLGEQIAGFSSMPIMKDGVPLRP